MTAHHVLGIDPSTKRLALVTATTAEIIGLTRWHDRKLKVYGPEAAALAHSGVQDFLLQALARDEIVDEVWLEAPAAMKTGIDSTLKQGYISGAIQAAVAGFGIKLHLVPPATWKAHVCCNGSASKDDVAASVKAQWPEMWPRLEQSQDLIDAAALYLHGSRVERRRVA